MNLFSSGQGKPIPRRALRRKAPRGLGRSRSLALLGLALALLVSGALFAPEGLLRSTAGLVGDVVRPAGDGSGGGGEAATPVPTAEATPGPTALPTPQPTTRERGSSPSRSESPGRGETTARPSEKPRTPGAVPSRGSGTFRTADLGSRPPAGQGRVITYQVLVEKDLPYDPEKTAQTVAGVLEDERSWIGAGWVRFELVDADADPDLKIHLATPRTTDRLCLPLRTGGTLSCQVEDRVVLNARRWAKGTKDYAGDLANYRRYLVNHEVGHFIGYGHVPCPRKGAKAPVMMQQTKGLQGCTPNPWPTKGER